MLLRGINLSAILVIFISHFRLHSIDVSNCPKLTEAGVKRFLEAKPNIRKFFAAHDDASITGK